MTRTLHTPPRSLHKRVDPADWHRERERLLRLRWAEVRDEGGEPWEPLPCCGAPTCEWHGRRVAPAARLV